MTLLDLKKQSIVLALLLVFLIQYGASGTSVTLDSEVEPSVHEMHPIYRTVFSQDKYYHLAAAKLLNDSTIPARFMEPTMSLKSNFTKANFKFNSAKMMEWLMVILHIAPAEERLALHVYDDPRDIHLASGPKVNQDMCGLHLAYMLARIRDSMVSIRNSTDLSIFRIMLSSDGPDYSTSQANTMFLGNYHQCISSQLNVIRDELSKINRSATNYFFDKRPTIVEPSLFEKLIALFGPLVGYLTEPRLDLLEKNQDKLQLLNMRYCVAGLRYPEWRNDTFSRRNMNFRAAICLPETCDSSSIHLYRDQIKQLVDFNVNQYFTGYYLDQLYCLPDEQSELRNPFNFLDTTLFILFNLIWLSLVVLATLVSIYGDRLSIQQRKGYRWSESKWWNYLSSWCLPENYQQFVTFKKTTVADVSRKMENEQGEKEDNNENNLQTNHIKVNLEPMEGLKAVSSMAIIGSHVCIIYLSNEWNITDVDHFLSRTWVASSIYVFASIVDIFFVASGILTVNFLQMRLPQKQLTNKSFWPIFILHRYLRIVPLWALFHWFIRSYFRFLGAGPRWDYGTSRSGWMAMCQKESFWDLFLPKANFKKPLGHCNHVGWYLANDIHLHLFVPLIMLIYLKNHLIGNSIIVLSTLLASANTIRYYFTLGADSRVIFEPSIASYSHVANATWEAYVKPQYRCVAFLIGIGAGKLLVNYQQDKIKEWPRQLLVGGKVFAAFTAYLICFMPFLLRMMPLENEGLVLAVGSLLQGITHTLTSVAAALFILFLCTGHLPAIARFFSQDFLKPLANMALTTLLVHIPLLYYHSQSLTNQPQASPYNLITTTIICCLETYTISFVIHLTYELPMRKILSKILFTLLGANKNEPKAQPNKLELSSETRMMEQQDEQQDEQLYDPQIVKSKEVESC